LDIALERDCPMESSEKFT